MGDVGRRRLVAQPGALTLGFALHIQVSCANLYSIIFLSRVHRIVCSHYDAVD